MKPVRIVCRESEAMWDDCIYCRLSFDCPSEELYRTDDRHDRVPDYTDDGKKIPDHHKYEHICPRCIEQRSDIPIANYDEYREIKRKYRKGPIHHYRRFKHWFRHWWWDRVGYWTSMHTCRTCGRIVRLAHGWTTKNSLRIDEDHGYRRLFEEPPEKHIGDEGFDEYYHQLNELSRKHSHQVCKQCRSIPNDILLNMYRHGRYVSDAMVLWAECHT